MSYTARTPKSNSSRIVRNTKSLRAALREATSIAKMFGNSVVTDAGGRALAHCQYQRKVRRGPHSPKVAAAAQYASCTLSDRAKAILKRKKRRR